MHCERELIVLPLASDAVVKGDFGPVPRCQLCPKTLVANAADTYETRDLHGNDVASHEARDGLGLLLAPGFQLERAGLHRVAPADATASRMLHGAANTNNAAVRTPGPVAPLDMRPLLWLEARMLR